MNASNDCRCPGCGQCDASRLIELIKKGNLAVEWYRFLMELDGSGLSTREILLAHDLSETLNIPSREF